MSTIEDNLSLIRHLIFKFYRVSAERQVSNIVRGYSMDYEDIFQVAAIAYLKAENNFKSELGYKLNTLVGRCIENELSQISRDFNSRKRDTSKITFMYLDYQHDDSKKSLNDTIADKNDNYREFDNKDLVNYLLARLSKKERSCVIDYFLNDKPQIKIAKEMKIGQPNVFRIIERSLIKMRKLAYG